MANKPVPSDVKLAIAVVVDGQPVHIAEVRTFTFSSSNTPIQGNVQGRMSLDPEKAAALAEAMKQNGLTKVAESANSWSKTATFGKPLSRQQVDLAAIFA
jgi:hypothetical protein